MISVLSRSNESNVIKNQAFIGSVLSNEPLRFVHPFLPSDIAFQVVNPEGEISFGKLSEKFGKGGTQIRSDGTEFIDIPFWSFFKGSVAYSAGENPVKLDVEAHETNFEPTGKYYHLK